MEETKRIHWREVYHFRLEHQLLWYYLRNSGELLLSLSTISNGRISRPSEAVVFNGKLNWCKFYRLLCSEVSYQRKSQGSTTGWPFPLPRFEIKLNWLLDGIFQVQRWLGVMGLTTRKGMGKGEWKLRKYHHRAAIRGLESSNRCASWIL